MSPLTLVRDDDRDMLTDRQRDILEFITQSINQRGYPPTLREIGTNFGIRSTNGVNDHLRALEKKGYLQREDLKSRALRPVGSSGRPLEPSTEIVDIPLLGRVAAGVPLLAVENVEDTVRVDRFFIGQTREVFALR
ncbi:MAG: transcriptional repressor LexA, partial [Polyangia bacterium]